MECNNGMEFFNSISDVFKAISDPLRLKILHVLQNGELCVSDLVANVNCSQANVSKHLGVLKRVGFVNSRRAGHNIYYSIQDESVFQICSSVSKMIENRLENEREMMSSSRQKYKIDANISGMGK